MRVYQIWIDTRDTRGEVVQYIEAVTPNRLGAKARVNRINTHEDDYPNMVSWLEADEFDADHYGNGHWFVNTQAKLNPANVEEIRRRRRAGESVNFLAAEFNVSTRTISRVVNGHTWQAA
jgi:hypothetical protein